MDNSKLHVRSEGRSHLKLAFLIAFESRLKAEHYALVDDSLVLFWSKPPDDLTGDHKLPFAMTAEQAVEFAWGWLEQQELDKEHGFNGFDGSVKKGFEVTTGGKWQ